MANMERERIVKNDLGFMVDAHPFRLTLGGRYV
jgi:hypothetical protein